MQDGIDASDMILLCPLATLSGSEKSRGITPTKTQTNKNSRNIQKLIYFFIPQNLWQSIWRWRAPCEREWKCSGVLKKWPVGKCSVLSIFPFCTSRKKWFFFLEKASTFWKSCIHVYCPTAGFHKRCVPNGGGGAHLKPISQSIKGMS